MYIWPNESEYIYNIITKCMLISSCVNDFTVNEHLTIMNLYPVKNNRGPEGISQNDKKSECDEH